jgi:hypothetical protein
MSKKASLLWAVVLIFGLCSFGMHRYYVAIYQVDFAPEKKRIEITARIFLDDLNLALEKEFKTKIQLGEKRETAQDVVLLQKYMSQHLKVSIDGKEQTVFFLSKEIENNIMIIYLKINDVKKFKSIKIYNNALLEVYSEQQNIIQTNFYNTKRNYIFTGDYFVENITIK